MDANKRAERKPLVLSGRITWKDAHGTTRFASVVTRDISATGVFIELRESTSIPMFRLVSFQLERDARTMDEDIPPALRAGRVLSAVYRHGEFQRSTGTPNGYGLRLLIEPARNASAASTVPAASMAARMASVSEAPIEATA